MDLSKKIISEKYNNSNLLMRWIFNFSIVLMNLFYGFLHITDKSKIIGFSEEFNNKILNSEKVINFVN